MMFLSRKASQRRQEARRSIDNIDRANQETSLRVPETVLSLSDRRGRSKSSGSINAQSFNDFDDDYEENHLQMPLQFKSDFSTSLVQPQGDDLELLVLYRNFFAFLYGGALVATPRQVSLYAIFIGISTLLKRFEFSNLDGSDFGEVVTGSFSRYCDELRLADVRASREKTIEAIVLGEHTKSWPLYNEGFVHAAGKLFDMKQIASPKYEQISPVTRNRLERASIDLEGRIRTVRHKLEDFEFPSMFSGIANSQMAEEAKLVRFKAWKASFINFRKHTIAHYRQRYGAWPPKASSKKNNFEESGLNRLLLKELYEDFTDLYDMLVDRTSITNRTIDMMSSDDGIGSDDSTESIQHAIRRVESEYDRSTPPVQPPIPFDTPIIPSLSKSFNREHVLDPRKNPKERVRRLKDNEVNELLLGSYNRESMKATPWLEDFFRLERRSGHGKTMDEIIDNRCGQWLFMYAVLQSLPMCVVDARDLSFTHGVEYFLCVAPRGGRPWMKEDTAHSRSWYNVARGSGIVSLPAEMIDHSVEGIYQRSHCWEVAAKWARNPKDISPTTQFGPGAGPLPRKIVGGHSPCLTPQMSPHHSPKLAPMMSGGSPLTELPPNRSSSSLNLGFGALPIPADTMSRRTQRPMSMHNPNLTFDTILAKVPQKGKK